MQGTANNATGKPTGPRAVAPAGIWVPELGGWLAPEHLASTNLAQGTIQGDAAGDDEQLAEDIQQIEDTTLRGLLRHRASVWASMHWTADGQPLQLMDRPWLMTIYDDTSRHIVIEKANQMGITVWAFQDAVRAALLDGHNVIYYFPHANAAARFSKGRGDKMLLACKPVADTMRKDRKDADLSVGGGPSHAVHLKQIGDANLYFSGLAGLLSTEEMPANRLYFDERDKMATEVVATAQQRLAGQEWASTFIREFSVPSIPGYGIDESFNASTQLWWHMRCRCEDWCCPEEQWPNCIEHGVNNGGMRLVCARCKAPLDPRQGRWIPHGPAGADATGYHVSQLMSATKPLRAIWADYAVTYRAFPWKFLQVVLGLAFMSPDAIPSVDADFTRALSLGCSLRWARAAPPEVRTNPDLLWYAGIDAMGKDAYAVVKCRLAGRKEAVLADLVVLRGSNPYEEARQLFRWYPDLRTVVLDLQPDTASARKFARAHQGVVWLATYDAVDRVAHWRLEDDEGVDIGRVSLNRSEMIASAAVRIRDGLEWHPPEGSAPTMTIRGSGGKPVIENLYQVYKSHLMGVVRQTTQDKQGRVRVTYERRQASVDPHFVHANAYCTAALQRDAVYPESMVLT